MSRLWKGKLNSYNIKNNLLAYEHDIPSPIKSEKKSKVYINNQNTLLANSDCLFSTLYL